MSKRIVVIYGIASNSKGPLAVWSKQLTELGYDVKLYEYEKRHFWSYWNKSNMDADAASLLHSDVYEPGCNVICHSNGHIVVQNAVAKGAKFDQVFIFSGAGTSDKFVWPQDSMNKCHWFVNISDMAVWFGAKLPFDHPFGGAARSGYTGPWDSRHVNYKFDRDKFFNRDHSFWFTDWSKRTLDAVSSLLQTNFTGRN